MNARPAANDTRAADQQFIVVGVDGTRASVEALRWAITHARSTGARLDIITAFDLPWTIMVVPTYTEADYSREAQRVLDESLAQVKGEIDVPYQTRLVQWPPGPALTHAAEGALLLVVGSHGYGALPGMHLGSVANYCVHHAPCPVLVHRVDAELEEAEPQAS